ncbi:galactose-1-phosphate uridylyltransferase [Pseudanabaena sp. FACHB-1998]|uniref:galactose-1-phosphate uridylyltransferase n=1 Tax=Pseudanabaena sp. FACHB-1998 TaxID=2692858 RepID=UPI001680980F|nr:galactose-1-phosphate uridylyltransferase [Pseudanabaena sp. FACHB-1998]MBD2177455.1 galactose-1-phosphate uridylyltransferase [Pseudanabaena sp. FACHB-1998]
MSHLRQNLITKDWVVFATERAKRPHEFARSQEDTPLKLPIYKHNCPFCMGNENPSEPESLRITDERGWRVRIIPNKYPALSPTGERLRQSEGIHRSINGVGYHEVIIEHPEHNANLAMMEVSDAINVLRSYRDRYNVISKDSRIASIIIFKNHGESAGTSLEHPHSQIAATPVVPSQIRYRMIEATSFFDDMGECLFCYTLNDELKAKERIVLETDHFVAFIPYAALSPFHIWVFPRRHSSNFGEINDDEVNDLAYNLKTVLSKLFYGLNNPAYNYTIRSMPTDEKKSDYFHWYLAIVPRVSQAAGFELGSGMYINTAMPEDSAKFLRDLEIE